MKAAVSYSRTLLIAALACNAIACASAGKTQEEESRCLPMYRFLIPQGYVGWIRVDFNVNAAQPLPAEGNHLVFTIPESGYLRTPARHMCGWPQDFYYYSGNSRTQLDVRKMIRWNGFASGAEPTFEKEVTEYIFIGTDADFDRYGKGNRDPQGVPRYGRLK